MAIKNETTARITRVNRTGYTFKAEGEGGAALEVQGMTIHVNDGEWPDETDPSRDNDDGLHYWNEHWLRIPLAEGFTWLRPGDSTLASRGAKWLESRKDTDERMEELFLSTDVDTMRASIYELHPREPHPAGADTCTVEPIRLLRTACGLPSVLVVEVGCFYEKFVEIWRLYPDAAWRSIPFVQRRPDPFKASRIVDANLVSRLVRAFPAGSSFPLRGIRFDAGVSELAPET